MAERTGYPVCLSLWSYVKLRGSITVYTLNILLDALHSLIRFLKISSREIIARIILVGINGDTPQSQAYTMIERIIVPRPSSLRLLRRLK